MKTLYRARALVIWSLYFALTFVILKAIARVAYTVYYDLTHREKMEWYVHSHQLGWDLRPGFSGTAHGEMRRFDSKGFLQADSSQIDNEPGGKVLFLGDSNTFGLRVPTEATFVELVDEMLPEVKAINLGVVGYTSFQGLQILKKRGLTLHPDIVVVSFNFNDRRYVTEASRQDSPEFFAADFKQRKIQGILDHFRVSYLFRSLQFVGRTVGFREVALVRLNSLVPRVNPDNYRNNLHRIVELVRTSGAEAIFMLLTDNSIQVRKLKKGLKSIESSKLDQAVESFEMSANNDGARWFKHLARLQLAKVYETLGKTEERERALLVKPFVSLHGGFPIRFDFEYNQIMKEVAEELGVEIINAGAVLNQTPEDYRDFCHPDQNGHKKIAYLLAEVLRGKLAVGVTPSNMSR